ncbi:SGNH/GDSL hydrolase family protein [Microcystis sp. 0824]|uniref:SGNH/GDSL hydrolase family protein n=1 Tax=Microcystis sp. 0824 TaxID=1502726 RepID=UPI000D596C10|nr:SGNH/GDSL hydrolase family protein [Microcystis sp. 0824]
MLLEIGIIRLSLIILGVLFILGLLLEAILRIVFGFGNPLIYKADAEIGYLLAPNQQTRRFSNFIAVNQYSMRSDPITPQRPPETTRIMLIGDSIANGSWWTDQKETIAALITKNLGQNLTGSVQVLNASANSWGPRNQLAYLRRFGTFESQVIVLLMNTDDLFALAPSSAVVGREINYPTRRPALALIELYDRYFKRYPPLPPVQEGGDRVGNNLTALAQIQALAQANQARLIIAITPLIREAQKQGRDYELKARQRLADFTSNQQIFYLDFLPIFQAHPNPDSLYRDNIHLSRDGNELISQKLTEAIKNVF